MVVPAKFYCFDDVRIDCTNFRVLKNGDEIALTPKAFDVLAYLSSNAGRVVEKQEIFDEVWKETHVGDNALTKIVKEIRRELHDSATNPRYIETVQKRGYRFIAEIAQNGDDSLTYSPIQASIPVLAKRVLKRASYLNQKSVFLLITFFAIVLILSAILGANNKTAPLSSVHSIAVLPFKPLNSDSRDESLEMGMAETLITRLSNLRSLAVRPMTSVRKFAAADQDPISAGNQVSADAVIDGNIQKAGERVRITVRLITVKNGDLMWSGQFDEKFTDIFKVQDSISERITNALTLQLSGEERKQLAKHETENTEAYQLYLQGQLTWNRRRQNWISQSLNYYKQALEKDPNFALAHIGVADAYIMMNGHRQISAAETEINARPSILRALEIDSTLAQAHNVLAEFKYQYEYDWDGAEKEFKTAVDLNPNIAWIRQAHGWFLMSEGRFDEAEAEMERAGELDPSSLTINVGRGRLFYYSKQYARAIQHFQNLLALEPTDQSIYRSLYDVYVQNNMYNEAMNIFFKIAELNNSDPNKIAETRKEYEKTGWQGFNRKRLANYEQIIKTGNVEPISTAELYVILGEKEKAILSLQRAVDERSPAIIQFKIEPAYAPLRSEPRFNELLHRIGLENR